MNVFERIKYLRKNELYLSQTEFGKKLGVSRSVIKNMELNNLVRPDQKEPIIKLISKTFGVCESWLKTGEGEMYSSSPAIAYSINARIKEFRRSEKLSQIEFANLIGLKQTTISYMEQEGTTITHSNLKLICKTFNLSENWLRAGIGEMYNTSDTFIVVMNQINEHDSRARQAILDYWELSTEDKENLWKLVDTFAKK